MFWNEDIGNYAWTAYGKFLVFSSWLDLLFFCLQGLAFGCPYCYNFRTLLSFCFFLPSANIEKTTACDYILLSFFDLWYAVQFQSKLPHKTYVISTKLKGDKTNISMTFEIFPLCNCLEDTWAVAIFLRSYFERWFILHSHFMKIKFNAIGLRKTLQTTLKLKVRALKYCCKNCNWQ